MVHHVGKIFLACRRPLEVYQVQKIQTVIIMAQDRNNAATAMQTPTVIMIEASNNNGNGNGNETPTVIMLMANRAKANVYN